ncbi:MAG: nuclear transport factor 2 family protein [Chloroflexota bacterium]
MSAEDVVSDLFFNLAAGDMDKVAAALTDDFVQEVGSQRNGKREFLGTMGGLMNALSQRSFNLYNVETQGNQVKVTVKLNGEHTSTLNLPIPGVAPVPPSGVTLDIPDSDFVFTFNGDKISHLVIDSQPGGGVPDMVRSMGGMWPA